MEELVRKAVNREGEKRGEEMRREGGDGGVNKRGSDESKKDKSRKCRIERWIKEDGERKEKKDERKEKVKEHRR